MDIKGVRELLEKTSPLFILRREQHTLGNVKRVMFMVYMKTDDDAIIKLDGGYHSIDEAATALLDLGSNSFIVKM